MSDFSHLNKKNNPKMVNVSDKKITKRTAMAKATMFLGKKSVQNMQSQPRSMTSTRENMVTDRITRVQMPSF